MFGDLIDLDFTSYMPDLDVEALLAALGDVGDFGGDLGAMFLDTETGEIVDAATVAAAEGLGGDFDPELLGIAGDGMDFSDAGFVEEPTSPLGLSMSDTLRGLEAQGQTGELWREQMDPFTGLTAEMPDAGFDWMKLLKAAGQGLAGLGGSGLADMLRAGGGAQRVSPPGLESAGAPPSVMGGMGTPSAPSVMGGMAPSIPSVASPERASVGGGGGLYGGGGDVGGLPGPPSSYVRDPISGLPVPATPPTPQGMAPLTLNPFAPLIVPTSGGQIPMAAQPAPRMSGLQRLLAESRGY